MTGLSDQTGYRAPTLAEKRDWLRLIRSENVGPSTFHRLMRHYGSAETALEMLPELSRRGGGKGVRIASPADIDEEIERLEAMGGHLIAIGEDAYPAHLSHIDGPPPLLSLRGTRDAIKHENMLAIVGARNASLTGRKVAGEIARGLGEAGFTVVSGLARGIDGAAHQATLKTGTVAVFAGGIDVLYPPQHEALLADIINLGGAAISEMPLGWRPRARDFPRRNRLISGVSRGIILIEAARASGSLHTARFAVEQNREVFVVPGSPLDPRSEGGNRLIREGATLVGTAEDVLESLGNGRNIIRPAQLGFFSEETSSEEFAPLDDTERGRIISALGPTPADADEIAQFTGLPTRAINVVILELEIAGRLERHSGGKISLIDARN